MLLYDAAVVNSPLQGFGWDTGEGESGREFLGGSLWEGRAEELGETLLYPKHQSPAGW